MPKLLVSIVESPAPIDILDERYEGATLRAALNDARIDAKHFTVVSRSVLLEGMKRVVSHIATRAPGVRPVLHLSMHGNADGVALCDGNVLDWDALANWLSTVNEIADGELIVSMSTCNGAMGIAMALKDDPPPFFALVGPHDSVNWEDTIGAFVSFYHHLQTERGDVSAAAQLMNKVIDRDLFVAMTADSARATMLRFIEAKRAEVLAK